MKKKKSKLINALCLIGKARDCILNVQGIRGKELGVCLGILNELGVLEETIKGQTKEK